MLEKLLEFERGLFFLINSSYNPFWDQVMWMYSGIYVWLPFIIFFCFMLIYKRERKEWLYTLGAILAICTLCIIFSSLITKPLFARPRPIFHPSFMEEVRTLYESILEPYGFVSGHSATSFGFAMFTSLLFRNKLYSLVIFLWALLMAYSRIYLGVHFISDIFAGGLAGVIIGYFIYRLYHSRIKTEYPTSYGKYLAIGLAGYIILFTAGTGIWLKFFP
ncbi:undecaprenyl-diphosphatase [Parabacteroides sp. PF5-5]|uniref:phosphatase PAP2 family protein n=1 Tax=unclassified Parabacteroides TaxID=2649774 RepID=UPI002476B119|nr:MULTISPECIES: phosphatase PAP2 family protein [unclassified Parabacteroides]MDH6305771.1 undecaprenyl-diphosphatase [Parabacteroides sp. PH5-39]MDH6316843.1 undecaprenyl-diphosphatase [Parabacteroides sp. PF5-13]MDH6320484.1 undecaprenyl-diphosphatase [Parabacteroides sp. PH5-13]MDH6324214.1 undecaprenyl-diphosphatase [Parabacteroides sp. PH5-8]MDH6328029.1 undecaprenyl-diphosphatase [Parabacteroides sp. PH5-41]